MSACRKTKPQYLGLILVPFPMEGGDEHECKGRNQEGCDLGEDRSVRNQEVRGFASGVHGRPDRAGEVTEEP